MSPFNSNPAYATAQSFVPGEGDTGMGRSDRTTCWEEANAWGEVYHPGQERLFARAGGWNPGGDPPENCYARTQITVGSWWVANTASSDPVPIDIFYFLDGWLFTAYYDDTSYASVDFSVMIHNNNNEVLYGGGRLGGGSGLQSYFWAKNGWSDAAWNGSWTNTTSTLESTVRGSQDKMFDLNYAENIDDAFEVQANTPFYAIYKITVTAEVPGPYEIFSDADFSHTSSFRLGCNTPGVTLNELNIAPEPGSLAVLGLGMLALIRRRR